MIQLAAMTTTILLSDNLNTNNNLQLPEQLQILPAGGQDPERFDWQEVWYPVFYIEDLDKNKPAKFTLLERDLVIWWDRHTNAWKAFDDRCPHRLVPLSEGRIAEDGLLECPYHGWAFKGDGSCDRIPQHLNGLVPRHYQRLSVKVCYLFMLAIAKMQLKLKFRSSNHWKLILRNGLFLERFAIFPMMH
jgi:nitrite reductase/ring-hydroxylating ferredoxin subunit